ncbi:AraC family transcriptional regulator [Acidovorax sp. LjRoot118]|uniref:AraC family transcriptional regulator n=1 Tax=Acidovorax sp. LjRoot118 TaxID=3342256 RepID=UPI003ECE7337
MKSPASTAPSDLTAPKTAPAATPIAFVQAIALAYRRRGMSPAWALAQAQIAPGLLFDDSARITAWQMEEVSGSAMRELDDEALGWFGRRLPWGSYGMLARASISSPDLGVALKRWCRHHGLLADDITLRLTQADTTSTLSIEENRDLGSLREFCLVSVLRNALGLGCWMVDSRVPLLAAEFAFAAPPHAEAYGVLFPGGPVRFSAPQTAIHFDARYLSLPLRRDEAALRQMLQHALPLTVLQYRRDRLLVARVRQLLGAPVQGHPGQALASHSAESLAHLLHVSPRTLHRQLKEEGATLQGLKDEVRQNRAMEILHRSDRPIKQVAEAAGFVNEKSFIRAFKGWTGHSPAEYRRLARTAA